MIPAISPQSRWVRGRALVGLLILSPFAIGTLFSRPYALEGTLGDLVFDLVGFILFLCGAVFRFWATLHIGGRKGVGLVMVGPYSLCRNPLYFGTCLMLVSLVVFLQSLTFATGAAVATFVYLSITVGSEEFHLRNRFGIEYEHYVQRVPRILPSFRRYQAAPVIDVDSAGLGRECLNAVRWVWIPVAGELLAYVRTTEILPDVFHLP